MSQVINYNGQLINLNGGVISANDFPLLKGLTLWLDPDSYGGSGDWLDRSTIGGGATLYNGSDFASSPNHFTFDGGSDFLRVTRNDFTTTGTIYDEVTVNMFVRSDGATGSAQNIITLEQSFEVAISGSRVDYASYPWAWRYSSEFGNNPIVADEWCMISFVHTYSNRQLFHNGNLIYDNDSSAQSADEGYLRPPNYYEYLTLAGRYTGTSSPFYGDIGHVYLHNRAMTQDEIQYMFNLDRDKYGI
jgi:hypothetical protein